MRFVPQYVTSSQWGYYLTENQMRYAFQSASLNFVSKNLHRNWTTSKSKIIGRAIEIESWISKHLHRTKPLLIIDDHESGWNLIDSIFDHNDQLVL